MANVKVIKGEGMTRNGQLRTTGRQPKMPSPIGTGVYDRNPSPGLSQYPADVGKNDIHVKFAETGVGDANTQKNQMRHAQGVTEQGKAKVPTSSNMKTSKNQLRQQGKAKQFYGK